MIRIIFLLFIFSVFLTKSIYSQNKSELKNVVFEGGGIRGVAYAGALQELRDRNLLNNIERVAGTSAGAIAATLFAVGYTPEEILEHVNNLNIKKMADGKWIFIGGTRRLIKNFGWYKGEKFVSWIGELIKKRTGKENLTFKELKELRESNKQFKLLYLTGANLTTQSTTIFCHETFPDMEIRNAARISISIPFFFQAVVIDKNGKPCSVKTCNDCNVLVDGGILANFPIHIFDYEKYIDGSNDSTKVFNYETIGVRLDENNQIEYDLAGKGLAPFEIKKVKHFTGAFYNLIIETINRQNLTKEDWKRTISISTGGIGPRIKKMPKEDKEILIDNGRKGVRRYLGIE